MSAGNAVGASASAFIVDPIPTNGSANPVSSDGVFDALASRPAPLGTPVLGQVAVVTNLTPLELTYSTPAAGGASNLSLAGTTAATLEIANSNGTGVTLVAPTATRAGVVTLAQADLIASAVQVTGTPAIGHSIRVSSLAPLTHVYQGDPVNTVNATTAASAAIDCTSNGGYQVLTVTGGAAVTFVNWAAAPTVGNVFLEINHVSGAITWPAAVRWPNNIAPVLTPGRVHRLAFVTRDAGVTIAAFPNVNYTA